MQADARWAVHFSLFFYGFFSEGRSQLGPCRAAKTQIETYSLTGLKNQRLEVRATTGAEKRGGKSQKGKSLRGQTPSSVHELLKSLAGP